MMTDAEVAAQIERADRFIADFREMVATAEVDPTALARRNTVADLPGSAGRWTQCRSGRCAIWRTSMLRCGAGWWT